MDNLCDFLIAPLVDNICRANLLQYVRNLEKSRVLGGWFSHRKADVLFPDIIGMIKSLLVPIRML